MYLPFKHARLQDAVQKIESNELKKALKILSDHKKGVSRAPVNDMHKNFDALIALVGKYINRLDQSSLNLQNALGNEGNAESYATYRLKGRGHLKYAISLNDKIIKKVHTLVTEMGYVKKETK